VHAAGRAPDLDTLDLAAAGIRLEHGRIALNEFLQSPSNPRIYAAGDAAGSRPPLTPVSSHDAKVVAGNLLDGNRYRPDYRGVPSVAFTVPSIAAVGLSETEALAQGLRLRVKSENVPGWFTARRLAERVYGFKTLVEEDTGRILGAHIVGPSADEVINLFALAICSGAPIAELPSPRAPWQPAQAGTSAAPCVAIAAPFGGAAVAASGHRARRAIDASGRARAAHRAVTLACCSATRCRRPGPDSAPGTTTLPTTKPGVPWKPRARAS
jgi:hypothetical protein